VQNLLIWLWRRSGVSRINAIHWFIIIFGIWRRRDRAIDKLIASVAVGFFFGISFAGTEGKNVKNELLSKRL
jgi:hypothetical protein